MGGDVTLMAVGAGLFLSLAIALREVQLARERALGLAVQEQLRLGLDGARLHVRRLSEDLFVLQQLLVEAQVLGAGELARGRRRLIEAPQRQAEARDALQAHLGAVAGRPAAGGTGKLH